jgi:hypothetical protein
MRAPHTPTHTPRTTLEQKRHVRSPSSPPPPPPDRTGRTRAVWQGFTLKTTTRKQADPNGNSATKISSQKRTSLSVKIKSKLSRKKVKRCMYVCALVCMYALSLRYTHAHTQVTRLHLLRVVSPSEHGQSGRRAVYESGELEEKLKHKDVGMLICFSFTYPYMHSPYALMCTNTYLQACWRLMGVCTGVRRKEVQRVNAYTRMQTTRCFDG